MKTLLEKISRIEFELRIFVSFSIVIIICLLSYILFSDAPTVSIIAGSIFNLKPALSSSIAFTLLAIHMLGLSLLRMWAGSILTSHRVMAFKVQTDALIKEGPFALVRNPIYLADWLAMCGFVLFLPPVGLLLPVLFYLHYNQLIKY